MSTQPPVIAGRTWTRSSRRDRRLLLSLRAVDEDVHVLADPPLLVEHPARDRRVRSLELDEHVADGAAVHDVVPRPPQSSESGARSITCAMAPS